MDFDDVLVRAEVVYQIRQSTCVASKQLQATESG
jgi:hypothetical protein